MRRTGQVTLILIVFMVAATVLAGAALWVVNQLFGAPPVSLRWALFGGAVFTLSAGLSYGPKRR